MRMAKIVLIDQLQLHLTITMSILVLNTFYTLTLSFKITIFKYNTLCCISEDKVFISNICTYLLYINDCLSFFLNLLSLIVPGLNKMLYLMSAIQKVSMSEVNSFLGQERSGIERSGIYCKSNEY